ncbi:MAG: serine/threonine-protein kinase, partial [Polyangiales bacterium]
MPAAGDVFGRYRLEALLGQGGMGQVFRAYDEVLKRRVAIKLLLDDGALGTEGKARLLREAQAAASLDHPYAVHVYDVGEHDGVPFIAMELVEGTSMREALKSLPQRIAIRLLGEIAEALAAAHDLG